MAVRATVHRTGSRNWEESLPVADVHRNAGDAMDVLIVEKLEAGALAWLEARHALRYAPELATDSRGLRLALFEARVALLPTSVRVDANLLAMAPRLRAVGHTGAAVDHIDVDACHRMGVEVVRGVAASAPAEAEFVISALILLLRGGATNAGASHAPAGRELAASTVGVIGMAPAARCIASMLSGFGSRLVGYDPALHASDPLWGRWRIEPLGLASLLAEADAVRVQLPAYSRYAGLLGARFLEQCKPGQVVLSTAHAGIFDRDALAEACRGGRLARLWFDNVDAEWLAPESPLHGLKALHVTPRLAGATLETRERGVQAVLQRLDEVLRELPPGARHGSEVDSGPVSVPGPLAEPTVVEVLDPRLLSPGEPFAIERGPALR